jgi:LysR family transcriptional regulator for bpeEF and oprC
LSSLKLRIDAMAKVRNSTDSLSAIAIFVAVGESASLTSAAQKLQMSVSGVSKAVSRLEEKLRVRLVNRTSRRITLTHEGSAYFKRCRQVLLDLEEAEATIARSQSQPRGRLRVLVPRALGKKILIPAMVRFLEQYPDISVDLVLDARSLNLEEEGFDVALRYGRPADSLLVARKLCRVNYLVCASPDFIRWNGEPQTLEDIRRYRCINYVVPGTGRYRQWDFFRDGGPVSLDIEGAINVNDMGALADAAIIGTGLAYLPDFMVVDQVAAGHLKIVLPDWQFPGDWIYMVYPRRRYFSPRFRVFSDFVRALLPPAPPWQRNLPQQAASLEEHPAVAPD